MLLEKIYKNAGKILFFLINSLIIIIGGLYLKMRFQANDVKSVDAAANNVTTSVKKTEQANPTSSTYGSAQQQVAPKASVTTSSSRVR